MRETVQYLHCDKCDVVDQLEADGITDEDRVRAVIGAIYEVEFTIDADTGTILEVKSGNQTLNSNTKEK